MRRFAAIALVLRFCLPAHAKPPQADNELAERIRERTNTNIDHPTESPLKEDGRESCASGPTTTPDQMADVGCGHGPQPARRACNDGVTSVTGTSRRQRGADDQYVAALLERRQ